MSTDTMEFEVVGQVNLEALVPSVTNQQEIEALASRYDAEAQADLEMVKAVVVDSDAKYEEAGMLRVALDRKRKGGEGVVEVLCGPLYRKWKTWRDLFMKPVNTRTAALKILSDKRLAYQAEQERKAEAARLEAERVAKAEQDRLNKLAEERARRAEKSGRTELAEEIRTNVPVVTPPPVPVAPPPKTSGVAGITRWSAELIGATEEAKRNSLLQLVTAVAAGEVPLDAVTPNQPWLNKTAAALKMAMKYPGVRVVSTKQERSTGR